MAFTNALPVSNFDDLLSVKVIGRINLLLEKSRKYFLSHFVIFIVFRFVKQSINIFYESFEINTLSKLNIPNNVRAKIPQFKFGQ